jgi:tetratricopeptide (TPR) repeat protein
MIMRKIIVSIFLVLNFLCSCSERSETALDWFNKAKALNYTDQKKAIEYLNNAIKLNPSYADAYNDRGIAYTQLGQYQRAIEEYNEAIRLKPDNVDTYNNRGASYLKQGNKNLGCRDLQKACVLKKCELLETTKSKGLCR